MSKNGLLCRHTNGNIRTTIALQELSNSSSIAATDVCKISCLTALLKLRCEYRNSNSY